MRRRILPRIVAVGVLVLALAGCVRFQADLTLNPENTVDGSIVVAVLVSEDTDDAREQALAASSQIESELLGSLRDASGVTTSEYDQDDFLGSLITFDDVALDAFSGQGEDALTIVRDGDEYVFTGALDFSGESAPSEESEDDDNLTVVVTFPGEVGEHNGELSGTTVSWTTSIDQRLEMSARGAATPAGPPILLIVGIGLVVLLIIAAVVAVLLLVRSRAKKAAVAAPVGETPVAPVAPAAVAETPAAASTAAAPEAPVAEAPPKKPRAPRAPKTPPAPEA
ncbi:MAG: hypothetical protein WBL06_00765 [Pseudolysinimonas sp.]|jgi:hypothetical protein|uniref:LppM family (lipo)protein n=1 Tax=Pseudolysinimonas sp. TaxID=2680009 RepID=UPI003C72BEEF